MKCKKCGLNYYSLFDGKNDENGKWQHDCQQAQKEFDYYTIIDKSILLINQIGGIATLSQSTGEVIYN